jgi:pimeloyl-ACP methyl ester carboxylesterase
VERITGAEGTHAWVVEIPGTQSWNPVPQGTPMDVQTNGAALAGRRTAAESTVLQAMRRAGVPSSEPVLLAGHSQGGMTAAGLAAKAQVRAEFHITHVLTTGSPVATMAVPPDVRVLSFEHRQDLVPRLDGAANPDAPHWTTVSRDLGRVDPADPLAAHDGLDYAGTADLLDDLDAVREWRRSASVFFDRPGATSSTTDSVGTRLLR